MVISEHSSGTKDEPKKSKSAYYTYKKLEDVHRISFFVQCTCQKPNVNYNGNIVDIIDKFLIDISLHKYRSQITSFFKDNDRRFTLTTI